MKYLPASDNPGPYILLARDENGNEFFYSGRAGKAWIEGTPFEYISLDRARMVAKNFNQAFLLTGLYWIAVAKGE